MSKTALTGPRVEPASGAAGRLVVFLHGYGANGADLIGLAQIWQSLVPDALFVAPNAPNVCAINPDGFEWFDLSHPNAHEIAKLAADARAPIEAFLSGLWAETSLSARETLLVGFSQGTMMALDVGLRLADPLAAIIGFSGALPGAEALAGAIRSRPPVCLVHGDADPVVPYALGLGAREVLEKLDVPVTFHTSPGAGHTIVDDGLAFATRFLMEIAGAGEASET